MTGATRLVLTAAALLGGHLGGPWPMSAFTPPQGRHPTRNHFEGRLRLTAERGEAGFRVRRDVYGDANASGGSARHLPDFDFRFVQDGNALIPVRRGAIPSAHSEWEFILDPGRVWDEPGDRGFTRAALPFALEERNANCIHNGVLTFLFRDDGRISDVAYEIGQETCAYFQFDAWGHFAATYVPDVEAGDAQAVARFRAARRERLTTKPIASLAQDYPGADPAAFGSPSELPAAGLTTYGVVAGGVRYQGSCPTRFGPYPFCAEIVFPSYSLAKSIVGGLGLMRLALEYPRVLDARIADYVPACSSWGAVTFRDTLDMATGRYRSAADQQDEDGPDMLRFFLARTNARKLRFACRHYPPRTTPGTRWVYHTADAYVLGVAMNAYWRARRGPQADFYTDLLVHGIWSRLHLDPAIDVVQRTLDAARQPFTGYGLALHADDIAKIADFLSAEHGRVGGESLIDPTLLEEALQRDPRHRGLQAGAPDLRYQLGFWAWNAAKSLDCTEPAWIPFMSGYGGIIVAMFPNGLTYYYVSDGGTFRWALAAAEANRIRRFCR